MHINGTLETDRRTLADTTNAAKRDLLVTRLKLHNLGHAAMTDDELRLAEEIKAQTEPTIDEMVQASIARAHTEPDGRHQLICAALMLGASAI